MPNQNSQPSKISTNMIRLSLGLCAVGAILGTLHVLSINRIVEKEISAELVTTGLPEGLTVPELTKRLRCSVCGSRECSVRIIFAGAGGFSHS